MTKSERREQMKKAAEARKRENLVAFNAAPEETQDDFVSDIIDGVQNDEIKPQPTVVEEVKEAPKAAETKAPEPIAKPVAVSSNQDLTNQPEGEINDARLNLLIPSRLKEELAIMSARKKKEKDMTAIAKTAFEIISRIPDKEYSQLRAKAALDGTTIPDIIAQVVIEYCSKL